MTRRVQKQWAVATERVNRGGHRPLYGRRVSVAIAVIFALAVQCSAPRPAWAETSAETARAKDITFDDIKFEMENPKSRKFKRSMLTKKIEDFSGKSIRIRGYILPTPTRTLTKFILVRDNMECCFGPGAALYDCIVVEMEEGASTEFTTRPVAVEGKFDIKEFIGPDGKHLAIYHLTGKSVK